MLPPLRAAKVLGGRCMAGSSLAAWPPSAPDHGCRPAASPLPPHRQLLPKDQRPAAQRIKKRAAGVQERLGAAGTVLRLLGAHAGGTASAKLSKALDALGRAKVRRRGSLAVAVGQGCRPAWWQRCR